MNINKPSKIVIDKADLGKFSCGEYIFQEKLDGEFAVREFGNNVLAGELVRGEFIAFDCVSLNGHDVRKHILNSRISFRNHIAELNGIKTVPANRNPVPFFDDIMRSGGEGVVIKSINSTYYDSMYAVKRLQTFICRVGSIISGKQSVTIFDAATGQSRGNLALRGGKCDQVRAGSVVKVEGFGETNAGKIREPRPDAREWLLQY